MGLRGGNRAGDGAAGQQHCLCLFLQDGPLAALAAHSLCQQQEREGEQHRPSTGREQWDPPSGARAGYWGCFIKKPP